MRLPPGNKSSALMVRFSCVALHPGAAGKWDQREVNAAFSPPCSIGIPDDPEGAFLVMVDQMHLHVEGFAGHGTLAGRVEKELQQFIPCAADLNPVPCGGGHFNDVAVVSDVQGGGTVVEGDCRSPYRLGVCQVDGRLLGALGAKDEIRAQTAPDSCPVLRFVAPRYFLCPGWRIFLVCMAAHGDSWVMRNN